MFMLMASVMHQGLVRVTRYIISEMLDTDKEVNIKLIVQAQFYKPEHLFSGQPKVPHFFPCFPNENSVAFPQKCMQLGTNVIFHWKSHVI